MSTLLGPTDKGDLVSLSVIKRHLNVQHCEDDELLTSVYLPAAVDYVAQMTGLVFTEYRYSCTMAAPTTSCPIDITHDTATVIDSIKYRSKDKTTKTVDPDQYISSATTLPDSVKALLIDDAWIDDADAGADAVTVEYRAGYSHETIPPSLIHAILLTIGGAYETREDSVVGQGVVILPNAAVDRLLTAYDFRY